MLYDPNEEKDVDVGNVEVQIKRDPTDDNNYRLHLGGRRVFQWFRENGSPETDRQRGLVCKMSKKGAASFDRDLFSNLRFIIW